MILVVVESPFAATTFETLRENILYARRCMRDCFMRGEAPYASHLLFAQPGILDDTKPAERKLGIEAGLLWGRYATKTAVYVDRGVSKGMRIGIERAEKEGRKVEYRWLDEPEYIPREAVRPPSMPDSTLVAIPTPGKMPRKTNAPMVVRIEEKVDQITKRGLGAFKK